MEKVKLNIEIDKDTYESIKKQFEEVNKTLAGKVPVKSIDEFIQTILASYVKSGEQMKKMGSKITDLLEKFGGLGGMDLGDVDLENLFGDAKKSSTEKKPEPPKTSNLKN